MAEFLAKTWVCDRCGREVLVKSLKPSGWHEAAGPSGDAKHACGDFDCEHWLWRFCEQNGIPAPASLTVGKEGEGS